MSQHGPLPRGPRPEGIPLVCSQCGRAISPNSDQAEWWLDAIHPETNVRVTRCPRHISDRPLRTAGVSRSKATWQWVFVAQAMDDPSKDLDPKTAPLAWGRLGETHDQPGGPGQGV